MNLSRIVRSVLGFSLALFACALQAQVTSSGITGVVRGPDGSPAPAVTVTAVHVPTNTTFTATTSVDGRFYFRSVPVGGPYRVSASGVDGASDSITGVSTQLGGDVDVNLSLRSEITTLDKFVVEADRATLDANATGAGTILTNQQIAMRPTTQRSLADIISASNFVTLRSTSGDREEAQISAVGQNARFNSIMIDGARINDQFGLNFSGLASFFNPLSIEWLEQMSVSVSPYDARQSGFTGAAINAVTKSGTNQFHGAVYYMFAGDELFGVQLQGEDVQTRRTQGIKNVPKTERTTQGVYVGGPIWKNHLFFFVGYEKFERLSPPNDPGFTPDPSELAAIQARISAISAAVGRDIPYGVPGSSAQNLTDDEKRIAKLDWNINRDHRLSVRYSTTEGHLPQFGSHTATTGARGVNSQPSGPGFGFTSYFYAQGRKEASLAAQLVSQWTPDFKTEFKFARTDQDQLTPTNSALPLINILNVNGISQSGTPTQGIVLLGTEFSRHGNQAFVDTKSYSGTGEYIWRNFVFTAGADREESDFVNLFRSGSYGQFDFNGTTGFTAGTVSAFNRSIYDPNLRGPADVSDFAVTGLFAQSRWDVTRRFNLTASVRGDLVTSDSRPRFNERLFAETGFNNTGTVDGVASLSPRLGFNWAAREDRKVQVRGGVGRFLGRSPWVFFSNSYNNIGVGSFTSTTAPSSLENYLRNDFDPANPIGTGVDNGTNDRQIDWADDNVRLPSVWRGNLAVDFRLPVLDTTMTIEGVQTYNDDAFFITNENLKAVGTGADGRTRYAGNPGSSNNAATALYPNFLNLYRIRNTSVGESRYISLTLERPMKNHWSYSLSYTRGQSYDAQVFGSTTAGSQFGRNPVFHQNTVTVSHSDFEVRNRVQFALAREFNFLKRKGTETIVSLYYEGRSGNPYSWVYNNDLNNDGTSANDLVAVPTGVNDPRFNFSALTPQQVQAYFDFLQNEGLAGYAGGYAPRNSHEQPWINRLDLHLSQNVPIFKQVRMELFMDFTNFGSFLSKRLFNYVQRTTLVESDTFWRRSIGNATYDSSGRIQPTLSPTGYVYDNPQSRWRVLFGAKLKF